MSEKALNRREALGLAATGIAAAAAGMLTAQPAQAEFQPLMKAALNSLKNARAHLVHGTTDKGGHRKKAINRIDQAIVQVNLAILYDNVT
jgi:hypothetical protein